MSRMAISLVAVAGLFGSLGVATAAAAAHVAGDPRLGIASNMLLFHAAAVIAGAAATRAFDLGRFALVSVGLIALGALLFSGDLLVRVGYGESPVPFAAPAGGMLLIGGWLSLAFAAGLAAIRARRGPPT